MHAAPDGDCCWLEHMMHAVYAEVWQMHSAPSSGGVNWYTQKKPRGAEEAVHCKCARMAALQSFRHFCGNFDTIPSLNQTSNRMAPVLLQPYPRTSQRALDIDSLRVPISIDLPESRSSRAGCETKRVLRR